MSDSSEPAAERAVEWSDEELMSTLKAYLSMLRAELEGEKYNKAEVNRQLREGQLAGRTKASVEFRMQNISAALVELKMPRIAGYVPARNIGTSVKEKMVALLRRCDIGFLTAYVPTADVHALDIKVAELRQRHLGKVPSGSLHPARESKQTTSYVRDPAVKAWVLQASNGMCEGCGNDAPFRGQDGLPYLEVHHVMPLSSHGSDTPSNAVALCPNCHRRCHYSQDRDQFKLELYEKLPRLRLEVPEPIEPDFHAFIDPALDSTFPPNPPQAS